MYSVLDNPIWNSLTSVDADKNIGTKDLVYLDAEIAPFIAMPSWDEKSQRELLPQAPPDRRWYVLFAEEVKFIEELEVSFSIPLYQFYCPKLAKAPDRKENTGIIPLHSGNVDEMIALTKLTKPGPFEKRTIEFGNYHGFFEDGRLVAMGGERLHLDGLTEISAICTHPDYQGRGYGAKIVRHLTADVIQKGETPFLLARVDNLKAMEVYKREGFEVLSKVQFYIFKRRP
jgi:GNAT superfamily N-acetyltransferase